MITYRDYQIGGSNRCVGKFSSGIRSCCMCSPCGSGKTATGALAALETQRLLAPGPILWIAHRRELIKQAAKHLEELGQDVGIIAPWAKPRDRQIQVGSIPTLRAREHMPHATVLVWDECHHALAQDYIPINRHYSQQSKCYQIGLTATPERSDGAGLAYAYRSLVVVAQPSMLIKRGYLVPTDAWKPDTELDKGIANDPYKLWRQHAYGKQTIVFCASVEHGMQVAATFKANGVAAAFLDAETPGRVRTRAMLRFAAKKITVIVNVNLFSEGVDVPGIECTIIARRVGSFAMYMQMAGRGSRPAPGKKRAILLDLAGAYYTFGLPDDDRKFTLKGNQPIRLSKPMVKVYSCPQCGAAQRTMAKRCPRCAAHVGVESRVPPWLKLKLSRAGSKSSPDQQKQKFLRWREYARMTGKPIEWAVNRYKARYGGQEPDASWGR